VTIMSKLRDNRANSCQDRTSIAYGSGRGQSHGRNINVYTSTDNFVAVISISL
jgi:hypothetical protein